MSGKQQFPYANWETFTAETNVCLGHQKNCFMLANREQFLFATWCPCLPPPL